MKTPLDNLLSRYRLNTVLDSSQALREIIQEIILLGLWRGKFFEHAAFYGGTALRIVHGLPRYSEDMDFSLTEKYPEFMLEAYFPFVQEELSVYGFDAAVSQKAEKIKSAVESAFVKMNTRTGFINLGVPSFVVERLSREQVLKVKFEIDIDPPGDFVTEASFLYSPQAFSVRLFDLPSMFAGKLHAAIARAWKTRVKGRDWFDLVWFVGRNTPARLSHLKARLVQTGQVKDSEVFLIEDAQELLRRRIASLDTEAAKNDVRPFLSAKDSEHLAVWSADFFYGLVDRIRFE